MIEFLQLRRIRKYYPIALILFFFFSRENIIGSNAHLIKSSKANIVIEDSLPNYNIFTPNGDGVNDIFNFVDAGATEVKGVIFDRWGLKVLEWSSQQSWWDGRSSSGSLLPEGTYFYTIVATYSTVIIKEKGFVFLIR